MSTYRKIDIEQRDENKIAVINYQKIRKDGKLTEKVFIKNKEDGKLIGSEIKGTSINESDWEIKGQANTEPYGKFSLDTIFKDMKFIKIDKKIIGGGSESDFLCCVIVIILILICIWFVTTSYCIMKENSELSMLETAKLSVDRMSKQVCM
jgi:hypothetical protein